MGNDVGTVGVCYDIIDTTYCFIFPNGEYCGFSEDEVITFFDLEPYKHCVECADYEFKNVMQLSRDFDAGYFTPALN